MVRTPQERPERHARRREEIHARVHVEAMLAFQKMGVPAFDYGNNIRQMAKDEGCTNARSIFPDSCRCMCGRHSARGVGPFRWVALSGDPEDIVKTDAKVKELIPDDPHLHRWIDMWRNGASVFKVWIASAHLLGRGLGQRHKLGLAFNEMVRKKAELKAPIVIGRDHLDSGSVASPNRETEAMKDGSDAVSGLADTQRTAQYGERRDVGEFSPRRWRWYGVLATCGRGDCVRWQRRCR